MTKQLLYFVLLCTAIAIHKPCYAQPKKTDTGTYDFVPRETVIFEDDFSHDTIGKFPSHWRLSNFDGGNKEMSDKRMCIVEKTGSDYQLNILPYAQPMIEPIINSKNYFTDSFTVEYDFLFGSPSCAADMFFLNTNNTAFATVFWMSASGTCQGLGWGEQHYDKSATYPSKFDYTVWHHFAIAYKNKEIKCYVDHYLMITVPSCKWEPLYFGTIPRGPVKLAHFRIATGKKLKPFNSILTERKFTTHAINFDINKSTIQPASMGFIMQLANFMKANQTIKLGIDGHTDSDGDATANITLSQARADEVKKQLVTMGIDNNRLTTKGFGASRPLQPNTTPEGKANNRRVEFIKL